jgi:Protein of unknown function (DUF2934)
MVNSAKVRSKIPKSESGQGEEAVTSAAGESKAAPMTGPAPAKSIPVSPELRHRMIAEAAYFNWLSRGYIHGEHLVDWLDAEAEIDSKLPC